MAGPLLPSGPPTPVAAPVAESLAVSLRGLYKRFDGKVAVAGVDLDIPAGSFFGSVDPVSARTIRQVLERYTASGATVVFSSHVMETVQRVCDRVAIMKSGRLVASGTVDDVRGGRDLEDVFVELIGAATNDADE